MTEGVPEAILLGLPPFLEQQDNLVLHITGVIKIKKRRFNKEWFWSYVFIAPMVIGTLVFGIFPLFYSLNISLLNWDGIGEKTFVGLQNFTNLLHNEKFFFEIKNTLVYTLTYVPLCIFFSVIVAVLLNQGIRATGIYRVIYFLPNIVMPVAAVMVWRFMLNSKFGIVNLLLRFLHLPAPNWISDPGFVLSAIVIVSVWSGVGYNAVILLAGLQGISPELYESARLDGSGPLNTFFKITIPLVSPTLFFLITMGVMGGMKAFDIVFSFANSSGPLQDATRTLVYGIYERAFNFLKMGEASAEAVVLFVLIMIVTAVQFALEKKWVHYE